jgi:hypothetical protein
MVRKKTVKRTVKHTVKRKVHVDGVNKVKTKLFKRPAATLPMYECPNPKCKHKWLPRTNEPVVCPVCHTPYAKRY